MGFDSGDSIEQIIKNLYPGLWVDGRSDNKGPEPESVLTAQLDGLDLLFLALERSNAIMVWDLTDLQNIHFLDMLFTAGDIAPEGMSFLSTSQSSYLAVANENTGVAGTGTTTLYRLTVPAGGPATALLLAPAVFGMLRFARRQASRA